MMGKVKQLTQNAEVYKEYQKWCRDPMTNMVFECMMEVLWAENAEPMKMVGQRGVSIEINALDNAKVRGACECMARMVNFSDKKVAEMPPEDYNKPWTGSVESGKTDK